MIINACFVFNWISIYLVKDIVMAEDRWLSVNEIANHLGIKRDTLYKWISNKKMPAHRIGRLWKFKKDEVDEWVKSGGSASLKRDAEL